MCVLKFKIKYFQDKGSYGVKTNGKSDQQLYTFKQYASIKKKTICLKTNNLAYYSLMQNSCKEHDKFLVFK